MVLCAFVLRMPPPDYEKNGMSIHTIKGAESYSISESKKEPFSMVSREYILTYFMFMMNQKTGLLVISKIQSIITDKFGKTSDYLRRNESFGSLNYPSYSDLVNQRNLFSSFLYLFRQFVLAACHLQLLGKI